MKFKSVNRILFITLTNIGDGVLTTPVLDVLIKKFPGAHIDVLASPMSRAIFLTDPAIKRVIIYDKKNSAAEKIRMIKALRKSHYDLVVDLKDSFIPYLVGTRYRIGANIPVRGVFHKRDRHLNKLKNAGVDISGAEFRVYISSEDKVSVDSILNMAKDKKLISISPSSKHHLKRWSDNGYAALCDRLIRECDVSVVLVGGKDDNRIIEDISSLVNQKNGVINVSGATTICQLAEIFKRSSVVVTNDSAPLHVASAVNASTVAIFGPTNPVLYGPLSQKKVLLRRNLNCSPCKCRQCDFGHRCMKEITVDQVFQAVKELL